MHKRTEITLQTKQNLIDAFWALYCEKRIEKITIKEITNRAGYNRGTFYEYFKDVYDVLEQIEDSLIPTMGELPPISIGPQMHGMPMEVFFELYEKNNHYYSVLLGNSGDPAFASKLKDSIKPMIMKELANEVNIDLKTLDYILEYTLSAMIGIMSYWFRQTDRLSNDELHEIINQLMQYGALTSLLPSSNALVKR